MPEDGRFPGVKVLELRRAKDDLQNAIADLGRGFPESPGQIPCSDG